MRGSRSSFLKSLFFVFLTGACSPNSNSSTKDNNKIVSLPINLGLDDVKEEPLLKEECLEVFQQGIEHYFEHTENTKDLPILKSLVPVCEAEFVMGYLEGQLLFSKMLLFEYALDLETLAHKLPRASQDLLIGHYLKKWKIGHLEEKFFYELISNETDLKKELQELKANLYKVTKEKGVAFSFGRYVFTPGAKRLYTLKDYKVSPSGQFEVDAEGALVFEEGSYIRSVGHLENDLQKNFEEFMTWKPSSWFGEDSLVYGAFWRDVDTPSIRDIKEEHYFNTHRSLRLRAQSLGLNTRAIYDSERAMLNKSRVYLDYHLDVLKKVKTLYILAPAFPLALKFGAAGMSYGFGMGTTAAANLSASLAAATFLGTQIWALAEVSPELKDKNLVEIMDMWIPILSVSLPASVAAPLAVGATAAGGKFLYMEAVVFWSGIRKAATWVSATSSAEKFLWFKHLPKNAARMWLEAWIRRDAVTGAYLGLERSRIGFYLAYTSSAVVAEIVDREYLRIDPDEKFFLADGRINPLSIYRLVPGAILGLVATPFMFFDNYYDRYLAYRTLDLITIGGLALVYKKEIDPRYLSFEFFFGATVGNALGEGQRKVSISIINSTLGQKNKFYLNFLFSIATIFPRTSIRNILLDYHMKGLNNEDIPHFREALARQTKIQFEGFEDSEIREALEEFLENPEVRRFLETQ